MSAMPRYSSGTRNVARSLTTATSLSMAITSPPPWQMPFTALTTGLVACRSASNGLLSMNRSRGRSAQPSTWLPLRSPPGMNTSSVPVMSSPARSSSRSTWLVAYRTPKYIAAVMALRVSGRSTMQRARGPWRSKRK